MARLNKYEAMRSGRVLLVDEAAPSAPTVFALSIALAGVLWTPIALLLAPDAARISPMGPEALAAAIVATASFLLIILPAARMIRRSMINSMLERRGDAAHDPAEVAWRCRAAGILAHRSGFDFDAWVQHADETARRIETIVFRHAWPAAAADDALGEELDLTSGRIGLQEKKGLTWSAILWTPLALAIALGGVRTSSPGLATASILAGVAPYAAIAAWLLIRTGLTPISVGGATISPRVVRVLRRGRSAQFDPDDSILLLERLRTPGWWLFLPVVRLAALSPTLRDAWRAVARWWARRGWLGRWRRLEQRVGAVRFRPPIRAVFVRLDGRRWSKTFLSGREDPALASLVARWTMPPAEQGSAPERGADSASPANGVREPRQDAAPT